MPVILNVVPLEGRKYKVFHDLYRRRQLTVVVFHVSLDVCEVCCTQREITSHGLHPKRCAHAQTRDSRQTLNNASDGCRLRKEMALNLS